MQRVCGPPGDEKTVMKKEKRPPKRRDASTTNKLVWTAAESAERRPARKVSGTNSGPRLFFPAQCRPGVITTPYTEILEAKGFHLGDLEDVAPVEDDALCH
jgi:hypothetical protein